MSKETIDAMKQALAAMLPVAPYGRYGTRDVEQLALQASIESLREAIKREEAQTVEPVAADVVAAVNALLHQIDIGDFVDGHGHSAKMLKPVHDLMKLLSHPTPPPSVERAVPMPVFEAKAQRLQS